jgi:hypothetical protein
MSNVAEKSGFMADIYVSEQLNRQMVNVSQDLASRCVYVLAEKFNFDAEEGIRMLGLNMAKIVRKSVTKGKTEKVEKVKVAKSAFPLPFNGEFNESFCYALRQNNGLYTQCTGVRKGENHFCKGCASQMQKTGAETPEYGTIQQRMAVGIFEYVDPKGRKPVAYTKVMKKYKLTQEMVLEEAGKLNITINSEHFVAPEESVKRGRPASKVSEPKTKGAKGRPKKSKKVIEIDGEEEDLFASLVKTANMEEETEEIHIVTEESPKPKAKKSKKSEEEKEAERLAKEAEKKAKEEQRLKEKAEKEAKLAAEKAEKEAKKEAERLAKEAEKKAKEEEKAAKKAAAEKAKEDAKKAKEEKKTSKPAKKPVVEEEDDEPDVVKKIEFEGKKYLKSKKTGIVYDYDEYTKNGEQVVVGKWNEKTNKIDFESDEEEEEEYDE